LTGTSPAGHRISLNNLKASTVVLYFWSASDKRSIREADGMEGVYLSFGKKGVGLGGSGVRIDSVPTALGVKLAHTAVLQVSYPPAGVFAQAENSPTYFMRWIGVNSIPASGTGQATRPDCPAAR
jgi:hypothetical protein